jgi:demethylmenaquinone methyltransferase/2-methoxy-6-polyprenyl-1,4-benzoquinol methylase
MPVIGRLISGTAGPYRYLAESIRTFPPPEEVAAMIERAGFGEVKFRRLTAGLAVLYLARKE